jgi:hypothetical protein
MHWAEGCGYRVDLATQHDLHADPELLDGYACVVVVGHDEYWSWEMRDALDAYIERGGRLARFGGNLAWQVRLEDYGATQICFKDKAAAADPVAQTEHRQRTTTLWDDPVVGRPAAQTFALSAIWGIYAGVGALASRQSGGFTVYRPEHWMFEGTGLGYGDVFGAESRIFGYEVDGLDYIIKDGLPIAQPRCGAPASTEIVAMALAANTERSAGDSTLYYGDSAAFLAPFRYGAATPEACAAASRGAGMIVHAKRGRGELINAGSSEWVAGLAESEPFTARVTANILNRFTD